MQENGRTQFKFRYALKQDKGDKVSISRELKLPDNPLLLLHTKVLLIKNIDAESFFTVNITTRQKMILDKCRNIKRKITMLKPAFDFLQHRSGSLHSKKSSKTEKDLEGSRSGTLPASVRSGTLAPAVRPILSKFPASASLTL